MEKARNGTDSALIEKCIEKDPAAWSVFTEKYSSLICASAVSRLAKYGISPSRQDVEDIRQNVLVLLWNGNKLEAVKDRDSIAYWLAVVSGNAAIEYMRKKRALEPMKTISLSSGCESDMLQDIIPAGNMLPHNEAISSEIIRKIEDAVERLPEKERLVIKLDLFHNKKQVEIARMLNMPRGTVSSHVKRGKTALKNMLKGIK